MVLQSQSVVNIAIGSTNPIKVAAAQAVLARAFPEVGFVSKPTESGVPEQPWGDEETRLGALNRAEYALKTTGAELGLGLEGGLLETPVGIMTCAWCVIVDKSGQVGYGSGAKMLLPPIIIDILREHKELGPAMDALTNETNTKQKQGAIGILTNGLSNRQAAYEQLVAMAAAPFVTGFYRLPPSK